MPSNPLTVDVKTSPDCLELKKMDSSVSEHSLKVRKPYTITKQRERWTDEEHNKFLEALKLYSRAWRQIEEHIGTKTAVQIRSHAQKFFSKVVRETAGDSLDNVKTVEIPPPRPKRKPVHPYPRKLGHSSGKGTPVVEKSEWTLETNLSSDQENTSPTSVLSAVGSDTFASSVSTSPAASASRSKPDGALWSKQENGCQSATTSDQEDRSPSPGPTSDVLTSQENSALELDSGADDHFPCKEASSMESQATSLKLFGRTVLVTESKKSFSSSIGNATEYNDSFPTVDIESHHRNRDMGLQTQAHPLLQGCGSQWKPWCGVPPQMFYCLPSNANLIHPEEASNPTPWLWAFYQGFPPFPPGSPQYKSYDHKDRFPSCREEGSDDGDTASNTAIISESGTVDKSREFFESQGGEHGNEQGVAASYRLRPSERSAFRSPKASYKKSSRGFVPYSRSVAKEVQHPRMASSDGNGQGLQLSL